MVQFSLSDISLKLNEAVVETAFKNKTRITESVKEIALSRAAPAGEGLIGAVYRLHVNGIQENTTFIAKGLVADPLLRKSLNCSKYFQREIYFYKQILPQLCANQERLGGKERLQNCIPVCYEALSDGSNDFLLMEDLAASGFASISGTLSEHQIESCLKVLAQLHATSMALKAKRTADFDKITSKLQNVYYNKEMQDYYRNYLNNAINIDKEILFQYVSVESEYYTKFCHLLEVDVYQQLMDLSNSRGVQSVISHGDAWISNFLCTDDRAAAIDFQILRCCSPVLDVSYFLTLCSNICNTKELFYEAADTYYNFLRYYLKDMSIDVNTLYDRNTFWQEMYKFGKFGLLASLTSIPLMANPRCDVMESFTIKFSGYDTIPLECLWQLKPIKDEVHKRKLINAIQVHVDVGLI